MSTHSPYFFERGIALYHGDLREISEWLTADVLIVDPPYGMRFVSEFCRSGPRLETSPIANDETTDLRDEILKLWLPRPAAMFGTSKVSAPEGVGQTLIWDKAGVGPGMGDLSDAFGCSHEEIYLFGDWKHGGRVKRTGSVLRTMGSPKALTEETGHPTPKPIDLLARLIAVAAGTIADPCAGSGSTLVAAFRAGRSAIGVEIEERYCEGAAKRLRLEMAQGDLFR